MYYLYRHTRTDNNQPFYIGVGQKTEYFTSFEKEFRRAFDRKWNRTIQWKNIINYTEYAIEILLESDDYEFILKKETEFIKLYGRRDLGLGPLVNLNDGGGGNKGYKLPDDKRKIKSIAQKEAFKNGTRSKISISKELFQYNLDGSLVDSYPSVVEASLLLGISESALYKAASGKTKLSNNFYWSYKKVDNIAIPKRRKGVQKNSAIFSKW